MQSSISRATSCSTAKRSSDSELTKRFGFSEPRQRTRVSDLSGGERRWLQFLRLPMIEPNVVLLDESTNDLDIEALVAMEDVLDSWFDTLVAASHDRDLDWSACATDRWRCSVTDSCVTCPARSNTTRLQCVRTAYLERPDVT